MSFNDCTEKTFLIKPALAFRQPRFPMSWQELPAGEEILSSIDEVMLPWWPKFFGYHLVKLGALSAGIDTSESPIKHQVNLSSDKVSAGVIADIDDLPLLKHSVDVCVLSHALEFSLDPHHVIREANRVLIENGYMVITGFNPFSSIGLNKLIPYKRSRFPWNERFFSPNRVKDWLHLMGFEILADERCIYGYLEANKPRNFLADAWRNFASDYFTSFGNIYVIVAKKRRRPLSPIKPKWQIRPNFKPASVSNMNSHRMKK